MKKKRIQSSNTKKTHGGVKMKIVLKKEKFKDVENAFSVLQEDPANQTGLKMIKEALEDCFSYTFDLRVVSPEKESSAFFVMAVYPEISTMDKIIDSLMSDDKNKESVIKKLWEKNKNWTLEIDSRLLTNQIINVDEKELTALLLHEIGHIVCSNSLPTRFVTLMQYEIAYTNMKTKLLLRDKIFRKVLCIPILNACIADDKSKEALKKEIQADEYVKKMGYTNELNSVLKKLIQSEVRAPKFSKENNLRALTKFSAETMDQLRKRQENVVKNKLDLLKKESVSPYFTDFLSMFYEELFPENEKIQETILERAYSFSDDKYIMERFIFGPKKMERIDPAEIDYIEVKKGSMQSDGDKLMLISYLNSKLDLVNYYLSILDNLKLRKKYAIPHSYRQLKDMQNRLETMRYDILKYKIPEKRLGIVVQYPTGYEG